MTSISLTLAGGGLLLELGGGSVLWHEGGGGKDRRKKGQREDRTWFGVGTCGEGESSTKACWVGCQNSVMRMDERGRKQGR